MNDGYGSTATEVNVRCWRCRRLLGELLTPPWRLRCRGCKAVNARGVGDPPSTTAPVAPGRPPASSGGYGTLS